MYGWSPFGPKMGCTASDWRCARFSTVIRISKICCDSCSGFTSCGMMASDGSLVSALEVHIMNSPRSASSNSSAVTTEPSIM